MSSVLNICWQKLYKWLEEIVNVLTCPGSNGIYSTNDGTTRRVNWVFVDFGQVVHDWDS